MQPELFPGVQTRQLRPPLFPGRYLRVRVAYEDMMFAALSLILVLLGGFCLGVERGKRLAGPSPLPTSASAGVASVQKLDLPIQPPPAVPKNPSGSLQPVSEPTGLYVIQLASYLDAQAAGAEAERPRRRGFHAQVVKQGRYFELRAAGYRSRTEAIASLENLKRTYRDGFIKRVSS